MAGDLFSKAGAIATLEASGASTLATGTAVEANDAVLDVRSGGLAGAVENLEFVFELVCQWVTVTGVLLGVVAAELYLVPAIDGTNYPDVDLTGGASALPHPTYVGNFTLIKQAVTVTDLRFPSPKVRLFPLQYKAYILNRSGQTISAGWSLKVFSARYQYT